MVGKNWRTSLGGVIAILSGVSGALGWAPPGATEIGLAIGAFLAGWFGTDKK